MSEPRQSVETLEARVSKEIANINLYSRQLLASRTEVFDKISLATWTLGANPELDFFRLTSWLYVLYFEAGRATLGHFTRENNRLKQHRELVLSLRTWSQHNLDPTSQRDIALEVRCGEWFTLTCKTVNPRDHEHWDMLCVAVLAEALEFLELLKEQIARIESSEFSATLIEDWERAISRNWPSQRFQALIRSAADDLGFPAVDAKKFLNRYEASIRKQLRLLSDDHDAGYEMRKLVELKLITETDRVLPCTGSDIMEHLGIGQGQAVGRYLAVAKELFHQNPALSRKDMLGLLAEREV